MNPQDKYRATQDAFIVIERVGPLLSLSHLSEKNKEVINEILTELLVKVIKPSITETKATASGIIV